MIVVHNIIPIVLLADKLRNRNGKLEKLSEYMVASLLINRIVSAFDVLSIKRNHGRMISFDV